VRVQPLLIPQLIPPDLVVVDVITGRRLLRSYLMYFILCWLQGMHLVRWGCGRSMRSQRWKHASVLFFNDSCIRYWSWWSLERKTRVSVWMRLCCIDGRTEGRPWISRSVLLLVEHRVLVKLWRWLLWIVRLGWLIIGLPIVLRERRWSLWLLLSMLGSILRPIINLSS
jgi:hypothetical protein